MAGLEEYFKRVIEFPGVVRHPEEAKFTALNEAGSKALVEQRLEQLL